MEESDEMAKNHTDEDDNPQKTAAPEAVVLTMKETLPLATISDAGEVKAANNNSNDSSKSREEGELFSSDDNDDDDFDATGSASQNVCGDTTQMESIQASPGNETIQDTKAGECGLANKSASVVSVSSRASQHEKNLKTSEKNHGPFVPFVIRFSDDETGSDSDDSKHTNIIAKVNKQGVDRIQRPPVSSLLGPQKLHQDVTKKARPIRREVSHTRPLVSTATKINGSTMRNGGQKSSFRNFSNPRGRPGHNHIPGRKASLNLNANVQQLQDLRQLIAIRESELKLKAAQQTKNSGGGSVRNSKFRGPDNDVDRVRRASVSDLRSELCESDKKRLKTGELQSSELGSDLDKNLHSPRSIFASGNCSLMNFCKESVAGHDHSDQNPSLPSNARVGKQAGTEGAFSSANPYVTKEGNNIVANVSQSAGNAKGLDCLSLLKHAGQAEKGTVRDSSNKSNNVELDHTEYNSQDAQMPTQNTSGANLSETHDRDPVNLSNIVSKLRSDVRAQSSPLDVLNTNQQEAPLNNSSFFSDLNKINLTQNNDTDLRSLLDFEELLDKEIEEAQEHRRKCEVEEKNALMAYRKAQRVLIEAHARCSHLYSKRELYSAQLRSFMMENPNLFSFQRHHDQKKAGFNLSCNVSDVNMQLIPSSCHHVLAGSDVNNKCDYDADIPSANNDIQNMSNLHAGEQNLVSNTCHEPEESPSKGCKQPVSDGVCSPSGDLSPSSYEDAEIFELNQKSAQENIVSERISEIDEGREKDIYEESERQGQFDGSQDCLLLEASLRAQLFEKLKAKRFSKGETSVDHLVERRAENDDTTKIMETDVVNAALCEAENARPLTFEDDCQEERFSELPDQINCQFDILHSEHEPPTKIPMDSCVSLDFEQTTTSGTFLYPAIKNAFHYLKALKLIGVPQSKTKSPDVLISTGDEEKEDGTVLCKSKPSISSLDATESTGMDLYVEQNAFFSSNMAIDPVWPLCMYELRGKCNNDECSLQHVRDYSCASLNAKASENSDTLFRKQSQSEQFSTGAPIEKSLDSLVLAPPVYVVGLDILKPDSHSFISASPQSYGQCWQKSFSVFLVLSSLCPTVSRSNEPFLHGTEARIEVHSSWNRRLSYFQSRSATLSQLDQCSSDAEQSVEMALLNFKEEADKRKSRIEAVQVLARAIEDDPTSAVLWIVYLLIFYSNQKSIGKDDLFQYAVKYNKESYELWLLYINSRVQLEDRLAAYDTALWDLCHIASKSDDDSLYASQCILDIFLQMIDCLCMSGNVGRAIEKILELFSTTKKSDDHSQLSVPNIVTCLTISDKFIFWICCVYLLVYKKLPDVVVQRFECWKESSAIQWPSAYLRCDERQQAASLLEIAVNSLESYVNYESLENEKILRAAHLFALNHVRCVSVLEGLECSRNLLEKYIKLYPSCLELVLMSARAEFELGGFSFHGFEEALRNWPDEVGVQCIWNQYAGCALQNGKLDFVKELMSRWLHSVLEAQDSDSGILLSKQEKSNIHCTSAADIHAWFCTYGLSDTVFGMLNFSLHKLLQNDQTEARIAAELALKAASVDNYQHCLRELVPFWMTDSIQHKGDIPIHLKGILNILNVHLVDTRVLLVSEPLSRAFIKKIKKPIAQQLVSKLLSPVSADFSLMLMVLEVWHGASMLPNVFGKPVDLVDFVEAMMEILPSNYLLAVCVCKELCKFADSSNISAGLSFWAGSVLINSLYHAVPVAPEYAWVEAAEVLHNLTDIQTIEKSFHKKALSVYPFSIKLWKSYLRLSDAEGSMELLKEAKKKGIELE